MNTSSSLQNLRTAQLGILGGVIALGVYGIWRVGPDSIIGSVSWAPHAYNYIIWGSFGIILAYRWRVMILPALLMIYAIDEVIWTTTYVLTTCSSTTAGPWFQLTARALLFGAFGYYIMVIIMGIVCFFIIRPKIVLRWWVWAGFAAWFIPYVFIFHMPIMGNECLPAVIPGNLPWEIAWQFSYLIPAYLTFYPNMKRNRQFGDDPLISVT